MKEGKITKPSKFPPINEDEKPFDLPNGWEWTRLEAIGHDWGQKTPDSEFTYIDVGAINKELGIISDPRILQASEAPSRARKIVKQGTVIYSTVRPYLLNIAIIDEVFEPEPIASTAFAIIHPFEGIHASFIYRYLRSPIFIRYVESCQTGIAYPAVNDKQFFSGIIPIPPLAEQRRIVAKVDELMALCDRLEQQQDASIAAHQTLVRVLLAALTSAAEPGAFEAAWTRIADHFDALFTTADSIAELKQTILQLAVMGKLVPQNPADEPASVLLKQIAAEKAKLVKAGKIKKQEPLPPIRQDEQPFELPDGWEWVRFGLLVNVKVEMVKPEDFQELDQVAPDSIEKGTGRLLFRRTVQESGVIGPNSRFFKGQILYSKIRPYLSKAIIAEFDGLCSADMYPLEPLCNPHYLLKVILSEIFLKQVRIAENRVKMPKLNIDNLSNIIVPLAPVRTQQNIVSKIDELMALCDRLHARLAASQTTQRQLADAMTAQTVERG
ncbi:restriction modification system DNA specificity domain [Candidatus Moduliflexus flocculans]|uniref:Restriction modification system DNA specificity domain n=1 Tax=Candidatus Moduliflexus flocculans TaxID=1499966 RepID=A0A0S6W0L8_9BACT|nr:restriction modification system DNA specificity domain [Candidatus Moduliflexus flocculans]